MHAIDVPGIRAVPRFPVARDPFLVAAVATIVVVYALRFAFGTLDEGAWKLWFLKEHGLLERAQAMLWATSCTLFAVALISAVRRSAERLTLAWLALLTALTLFAFGEEVAWGQFLFGLEPGAWMVANNTQQDITVHNLDFIAFLGLDRRSGLAVLAEKAIDTAPYLLCIALWVGVPLAPRLGGSSWKQLLARLPLPGEALAKFFAANVVLYLLVDNLVVDVGEIFELVIAITFLLAAIEIHRMTIATAPLPERRVKVFR